MGRDTSGMEDDRPETCENKMPGYIGFEEGNGKLYCSLPTETSVTDSKVERSVGDLSHVLNANSAVILNRVGRESEIQPQRVKQNNGNDDEDKHAGSNGHGDADSRATALEILNRSVGILSRSRSLSRKQYNTDSQRGENVTNWVVSDQRVNVGDCAQSNRESGEVKIQEELFYYPGSETSVLEDAESDSDEYYYNCESRSKSIPLDQSYFDKEHVYCTVYCIANNGIRDLEITERYSEAPTALQSGAGEGQTVHDDVGSSPELYSLSDLVDPLTSTRLSRQQSRVSTVATSCRVCLLDTSIVPLHCCGKSVCDECLKLYISSQVQVGKVYIVCPIPECSGFLEEGLVVSHLENEEVAKYHYFLELCQLDASTKPCPQCSLFTSLKTTTPNCTEHKYKIQCNKCQFVWCFKCHAPWHSGLKCRDYRRGDKLLRKWASVIEHGQRNAQKCPRCKIHIQRTEGCDHMTCTQCSTNFCYRCGERYRQLRFFGDHTSNLSVFGCKYRYHPDKPHLRRLIRGSVCVSKVVLAPVVFVLVMALGALSLVIGLVVFPVYYVCKRKKKQQQTQGSGRWI